MDGSGLSGSGSRQPVTVGASQGVDARSNERASIGHFHGDRLCGFQELNVVHAVSSPRPYSRHANPVSDILCADRRKKRRIRHTSSCNIGNARSGEDSRETEILSETPKWHDSDLRRDPRSPL